jgi:cytochrome c oxidase subunit 4
MSEHAGGQQHVVPVKVYIAVFLALLALTVLTWAAAQKDLGHPEVLSVRVPLNVVVALAIAVTKAALVVLFFMHVKYSSRLVQLAIASAFVWLVILLAVTVSDYLSRGWLGNPGT